MVFSRLFRKSSQAKATHAVPDGRRVYAIGDIHGRDDLFAELLDRIADDHNGRAPADLTIVLLGDLIDRGPQSAQVVTRARALASSGPDVHWLSANHEEVFLKALGGDPQLMRYFVRIGGAPTIHSYGLSGAAYEALTFDQLAEQFPPMVPAEDVEFLSAAKESLTIGDYLFVHAGIKPGVPVERQNVADLRWIREEFLEDRRDHGLMIVHGHTITDGVDERSNRIGIDTGAYQSGVLTAIGLEGVDRWYLSTGHDA